MDVMADGSATVPSRIDTLTLIQQRELVTKSYGVNVTTSPFQGSQS